MLNQLDNNKAGAHSPIIQVEAAVLPEESGFFSRVVERIKSSFSSLQSGPAGSLKGRILEGGSQHASNVHASVLSVAKKLKRHLDAELAGHVQAAMELITRDFQRIQKRVVNATSEETEKVMNQWICKAQRWIELDAKVHDRAEIINTIMKQLFHDLEDLINQDLQVIFDYEAHILADLAISPDEKNQLEQLILLQLTPHTQALINLKARPENLQLSDLALWKKDVDCLRQKYFENALHAIDVIIDSLSPQKLVETETDDPATALFSDVELLEQACSQLMQKALQVKQDGSCRSQLRPLLEQLQQQAHELNGNLLLTHAQFDQVQLVQKQLLQIEALYLD